MLMKLKWISNLKIHCIGINETEILFPVLDHILEQHSEGLNSLTVLMEKITINS